jgi:hypothetical protein
MKRFPLEPLKRVRDLRLEAAQRVVAERRAELARAERQLEVARQARTDIGRRRAGHLAACEAAMSDPATLVADWFERAERHRAWLDSEILRADGVIAGAEQEVARAQARLAEEIAALRRAQAKVDALETFRGEWQRGVQRERERQEEQASEELFRPSNGTTG